MVTINCCLKVKILKFQGSPCPLKSLPRALPAHRSRTQLLPVHTGPVRRTPQKEAQNRPPGPEAARRPQAKTPGKANPPSGEKRSPAQTSRRPAGSNRAAGPAGPAPADTGRQSHARDAGRTGAAGEAVGQVQDAGKARRLSAD